ncbi:MAG TPA: DUF4272 domain-containing protein [Phycisphaerae bacterium]|nr:DUF4272 domain-containing protein [Phycisphaerae bacterium]
MDSKTSESRPTSGDAARRLVILKYVVVKALSSPPREMLREILAKWSPSEREDFRRQGEAERDKFWRGFRQAGLWEHMSPKEQAFAQSTLVTMTEQEQIDASWRTEAAQTLMWALGMIAELPPYDTGASEDLLKQVPSSDIAAFVRSVQLRAQAEVDRARDVAEFWHWRSRTRELIERGDRFPADPKMKVAGFHSFEDILRFSAREGAKKGTIPACAEDDFPAKGKAYRDLSVEEWAEVRSITVERHFTLNWLCGYAPGNRWDETPTDT